MTAACFMQVFGLRGFSRCKSGALETGWEKIALYVSGDGEVEHVARQLDSGAWTSKLGDYEDIEHRTLRALEGDEPGQYGRARYFMKRRRDGGQDQA